MKVLLLNPPDENKVSEAPDRHGNEYIESDDFGNFPPLGALYVLTYLEQNSTGHDLFFKDCIAEHLSFDDLKTYIQNIKPDVVGMTSFTVSLFDVILAARTVREVVPDAHLCLGGHHPIAFPFEAAQLKEFDTIIVGEGEIAFTELVNAIEKGKDYTTIEGVYTEKSVQKYINVEMKRDKRFLHKIKVPPAYIPDIDSIPAPNREYIKHINYQSVVGVTSKLATLLSSRGCPYKCTFCDVPLKEHRQRDPKLVIDEVEECLKMGYEEIHFYDDLFNIYPERIIDICDEIDRRGVKFTWDFRGRVNTVTYESLKRFKNSGGRMISFGIETSSNEGLKTLRKGNKDYQNKEALEWCRELGIVTIADYMIGLPHERSREDIQESVNTLIDYDPDYAQFNVLSLYPNTEVYDQAVEKGLIDNEYRWHEWASDPVSGFEVDHWDEFVSAREMVDIQKWAYRKFYFRPKNIARSVVQTRSLYEFKTKAKGALKVLWG